MIIGIGCDIVQIPRIEQALAEHGQKFEDRLFTQAEQIYANMRGKNDPKLKACAYAKRMAAKEAFVKAVGKGFTDGISWQEIEVIREASGQPRLQVTGNALAAMCSITPRGQKPRVDVSLTDDYPVAQAFVVISWS